MWKWPWCRNQFVSHDTTGSYIALVGFCLVHFVYRSHVNFGLKRIQQSNEEKSIQLKCHLSVEISYGDFIYSSYSEIPCFYFFFCFHMRWFRFSLLSYIKTTRNTHAHALFPTFSKSITFIRIFWMLGTRFFSSTSNSGKSSVWIDIFFPSKPKIKETDNNRGNAAATNNSKLNRWNLCNLQIHNLSTEQNFIKCDSTCGIGERRRYNAKASKTRLSNEQVEFMCAHNRATYRLTIHAIGWKVCKIIEKVVLTCRTNIPIKIWDAFKYYTLLAPLATFNCRTVVHVLVTIYYFVLLTKRKIIDMKYLYYIEAFSEFDCFAFFNFFQNFIYWFFYVDKTELWLLLWFVHYFFR